MATYTYGSHAGDPRSTQLTVAGALLSVMQAGTVPAAGETIVYYHTDALGSVRVMTDASGNQYPNGSARYDYLPFGQLFAPPAQQERRLFTGQERDQESKLDYFLARHLFPTGGRFTTPDPITLTPARLFEPTRMNRYVYASNNPLRYTDPSGLCDQEAPDTDPHACWLEIYQGLQPWESPGWASGTPWWFMMLPPPCGECPEIGPMPWWMQMAFEAAIMAMFKVPPVVSTSFRMLVSGFNRKT